MYFNLNKIKDKNKIQMYSMYLVNLNEIVVLVIICRFKYRQRCQNLFQ